MYGGREFKGFRESHVAIQTVINFVINFNKSISQKSIEYLGYSVSSEDISLSEVHSKAMKNYPYSALIIEQCAVF